MSNSSAVSDAPSRIHLTSAIGLGLVAATVAGCFLPWISPLGLRGAEFIAGEPTIGWIVVLLALIPALVFVRGLRKGGLGRWSTLGVLPPAAGSAAVGWSMYSDFGEPLRPGIGLYIVLAASVGLALLSAYQLVAGRRSR